MTISDIWMFVRVCVCGNLTLTSSIVSQSYQVFIYLIIKKKNTIFIFIIFFNITTIMSLCLWHWNLKFSFPFYLMSLVQFLFFFLYFCINLKWNPNSTPNDFISLNFEYICFRYYWFFFLPWIHIFVLFSQFLENFSFFFLFCFVVCLYVLVLSVANDNIDSTGSSVHFGLKTRINHSVL